jgi:uncharacterized protein with NRDE domain
VCLILAAWHAHPDYPLVVAANRDEYHVRQAAPAAWWDDPPMIAGRDLSAGGTWLGLTGDGRFAALTNYRDPERVRANTPSRGRIVPDTLRDTLPAGDRLRQLASPTAAYNGFNLLFGDRQQLAVFESVPGRGRILDPGVYGLSNHLLDTPWPKVVAAKAALGDAILRLPDESALLDLLRDNRPARDDQLPRTGVSVEWERLLSSAFIRADEYGTRCSTIITLDSRGEARFTEWTWHRDGAPAGEARFRFHISS